MVVIGLTHSSLGGNLSEQEGVTMYLQEQIEHELSDLSGSQAKEIYHQTREMPHKVYSKGLVYNQFVCHFLKTVSSTLAHPCHRAMQDKIRRTQCETSLVII